MEIVESLVALYGPICPCRDDSLGLLVYYRDVSRSHRGLELLFVFTQDSEPFFAELLVFDHVSVKLG